MPISQGGNVNAHKGGALVRAAEYLRMSTEHQQYSLDNQTAVNRIYAAQRGYEIVSTYADEGRSGLKLDGRPSLQSLLSDVSSGTARFDAVLVYDVSRWGRFQDPDEAASHERQCRRAGVAIHYCAEQFENDGSMSSSIVKALKRAMAAEYSRELSVKVFAGQARLARMGYHLGGPCLYGLRRLVIDKDGNPKFLLGTGDQKNLTTDRVILVPGPPEEVAVVRQIFRLFVEEGFSKRAIVRRLNEDGVPTRNGIWRDDVIIRMLKADCYAGHAVWAKRSIKLHERLVRNHPEDWLRCENAYEAIIDQATFDRAQQINAERAEGHTEQDALDRLRAIFKKEGKLSSKLIDKYDGPCFRTVIWRFGSLAKAYERVGYTARQGFRCPSIRHRLKQQRAAYISKVTDDLRASGVHVEHDAEQDRLTINGAITAFFLVSPCIERPADHLRWALRLDTHRQAGRLAVDIMIVERLTRTNDETLDYYVLPRSAFKFVSKGFKPCHEGRLSKFRHDRLDADIVEFEPPQRELIF